VQAIDAVSGRVLVDRFHAVSHAVRDDAVRHLRIPVGRITVVPRGRRDPRIELAPDAGSQVRAELGIPSDAVVLVNIGRQEQQKDHVTLVRAMLPLLDEHRNAWLLIAGREGNETPKLEAELQRAGQPDRIRLLGHRPDVPALLAAADVMVFTSRYEGMPGAVIEAMSVGVAVVASDIAPVREVAVPGRTALLAEPGDPSAFGRQVGRLLHDHEKRSALGAAGRARFEREFTIEASARGMAELYRSMVA
jgi:glycosyltransferase involved in cell wall biosynthesis